MPAEPLPVTADMPLEDLHEFADEAEQGFGGLGEALLAGVDAGRRRHAARSR